MRKKIKYLEPLTMNKRGKVERIRYNIFERLIRWYGRKFNNRLRSFREKTVCGLYLGGDDESCTAIIRGVVELDGVDVQTIGIFIIE